MIDFLIMLLSTDWFLPYWGEIGINIGETKQLALQQGCREIVNEMLDGKENIFLSDCSEERKQATSSKFLALMQKCDAALEMAATWTEWASLSHEELTAVVLCSLLNREATSADSANGAPPLDFVLRAEVAKTWEAYALSPSIFRDICLSSTTEWDIRTRHVLSSPRALVNQLWSVLLNGRLRAFWADIRDRLTAGQVQDLVAWYRTMIKSRLKEDRPVRLPSFMS